MKYHFGWALPDQDTHFAEYLASSEEGFGRRMYQGPHIKAALGATRSKRVALDIGAHVGFWSYYLAKYFAEVHAFEPVPSSIECFCENVKDKHVFLHETALGNMTGSVNMEVTTDNSGMSFVGDGAGARTPIAKLDTFGIAGVDLVKIDVEGYEKIVLEGARKTLSKNKPVIIIEQKPSSSRYSVDQFGAMKYLESLGAQVIHQVVDDFIMAWPKKSR